MKKQNITIAVLALVALSACGSPSDTVDTSTSAMSTPVEAEASPTPLPYFTQYSLDTEHTDMYPAINYIWDYRHDRTGYEYHLRFNGSKATVTVDTANATDDARIEKDFESEPGDNVEVVVHSSTEVASIFDHVATYGPAKFEKISDTEYRAELTSDIEPSDSKNFIVEGYYEHDGKSQSIGFVQTGVDQ